MAIDVEIVAEDNYVELICTGVCTLAEVKRIFSLSIDAALEYRKFRILISAFDMTGNLTTVERYESATHLADEIMRRTRYKIEKIAVCSNTPPLDPARFGETVANNRGVNFKAVENYDEAVIWISI